MQLIGNSHSKCLHTSSLDNGKEVGAIDLVVGRATQPSDSWSIQQVLQNQLADLAIQYAYAVGVAIGQDCRVGIHGVRFRMPLVEIRRLNLPQFVDQIDLVSVHILEK